MNKNTRKSKRAKYLHCQSKLDENLQGEPQELMLDLMRDKLNYLINH